MTAVTVLGLGPGSGLQLDLIGAALGLDTHGIGVILGSGLFRLGRYLDLNGLALGFFGCLHQHNPLIALRNLGFAHRLHLLLGTHRLGAGLGSLCLSLGFFLRFGGECDPKCFRYVVLLTKLEGRTSSVQ